MSMREGLDSQQLSLILLYFLQKADTVKKKKKKNQVDLSKSIQVSKSRELRRQNLAFQKEQNSNNSTCSAKELTLSLQRIAVVKLKLCNALPRTLYQRFLLASGVCQMTRQNHPILKCYSSGRQLDPKQMVTVGPCSLHGLDSQPQEQCFNSQDCPCDLQESING